MRIFILALFTILFAGSFASAHNNECYAFFNPFLSVRFSIEDTPDHHYDYVLRGQQLNHWTQIALLKIADPSLDVSPEANAIAKALAPFKNAVLGLGAFRASRIDSHFISESLNLLYEQHSLDEVHIVLASMLSNPNLRGNYSKGIVRALEKAMNELSQP